MDDRGLEEEAFEVQAPRVAPAGRAPTQTEIDHHVATGHAQHRSWCDSCMRARGIAGRHELQGEARPDSDPLICVDYAYMRAGDRDASAEEDDDAESGEHRMLIVAARDTKTGTYAATSLDAKGPTDYAVRWLCGFLRRLGYRRLILQSDGEASICALKNAVVLGMEGVEVLTRESPVGESASNGVAECAVREVKRQVRTLRCALEERVGPVADGHPILRWLPMAAADAISFYRIGRDGLTAEMRRTGRPWNKLVAEFGERVFYRPVVARKVRSGMQPKLEVGRYLGHHARTGSILVMTEAGVVPAAGFRRSAVGDRWTASGWSALRGLPWDVSEASEPERARDDDVPRPRAIMLPLAPRRRYVTRADLRRFGVTVGCGACADIAAHGKTSRAHTDECRARIGEHLEQEPDGKERLAAHKRRREEHEAAPEAPSQEGRPDRPMEANPSAAPASFDVPAQGAVPGSAPGSARGSAVGSAGSPATDEEMAQAQGPSSASTAVPAMMRGEKRGGDLSSSRGVADGPVAKRKAEPRRGHKRMTSTTVPQLEEAEGDRLEPTVAGSPAAVHASPVAGSPAAGARSSSGSAALAGSPALVAGGEASTGHSIEDVLNPVPRAPALDSVVLDGAKGRHFRALKDLIRLSEGPVAEESQVKELAELCVSTCAADLAGACTLGMFRQSALQLGLSAGLVRDLYADGEMETEAERIGRSQSLEDERPKLLIAGGPAQSLGRAAGGEVDEESRARSYGRHAGFIAKECEKQSERGGHFLLERIQDEARSDNTPLEQLRAIPGVLEIEGPMCKWELRPGAADFVRRRAVWFTNHAGLAGVLADWSARATEKSGQPRRSVRRVGGLLAPELRYPLALRTGLLKSLREDLRQEEELSDLAAYASGPSPHVDPLQADGVYVDDVRGGVLEADRVRAARREEVGWCRRMGVWTRVPRSEMLAEGGRAVSLRWVDTDKGDARRPNYRSRLCVREIKKAMKKSEIPQAADLFSGMPPLEAVKILLGIFVGHCREPSKGPRTLAMYDVSRAHFHGVPTRRLFIELPEEEKQDITDGGDYVGLLQKCMYGTVDASARWQAHYATLLKQQGFSQGRSNPALLVHVERDIRLLVHGDDFLVEMPSGQAEWFESILQSAYDFKVTGRFESEANAVQEAVFLNRVLRWHAQEGRAEIEADTRHTEVIVRALGLETSSEVSTPAVRRSKSEELASMAAAKPLEEEKVQLYRSLVMRINYVAQDRPDLSYVAGSLARGMKTPTSRHWEELKRVGRYLRGQPVGRLIFEPQELPGVLEVFCDADHAGDLETRRSRSGMAVMWGRHLVKHGSSVQSTIALSSGESEYYALLRASAHALGIKAILNDWAYAVGVEIVMKCDSSAARGIAARQGLGRMRHLDVRFLRLQQAVQEGKLRVLPVPTSENWSDVFTKPLAQDAASKCYAGMRFETDRVGSKRHRRLAALGG